MTSIDFSVSENWLAIAITGAITAPVIPIGLGPDVYIAKLSHISEARCLLLREQLKISFQSFGFEASNNITLRDPVLTWIPLTDASEEAIKNALIISDMALAFFNRKFFGANAKFTHWDRNTGRAIGAVCSNFTWKALVSKSAQPGPAIWGDYGQPDFWDWLFGKSLREELTELSYALFKSIEWEREAWFSSHITHRFAFSWIGLESMMPEKECKESSLISRYSLLVGAPRGAASQRIRSSETMRQVLEENINSSSKLWVNAIKNMYRCRCFILHEGASDLNAAEADSNQVEWFYGLTRNLHMRVTNIAVEAVVEQVLTLEDFWNDYVPQYLYSDQNPWLKQRNFFLEDLIRYDWEKTRYSKIHIYEVQSNPQEFIAPP